MKYSQPVSPTVVILAVLTAATGCSSSGGDDPPANEPPPANATVELGIADAATDEGGAGSLVFTVSSSGAASGDVTVDFSTSDGSAEAGVDFVASSGTVTIPAGATSAEITVSLLDDSDREIDETFTVDLQNPSSNATLGSSRATGTINDDDPPPVLSVGDAETAEGDAGTVTLTFQLTLSARNYEDVSVDYVTTDVSATAGDDYTAASGTAVIPAGQLEASVDVSIIPDGTEEPAETLELTLSNVSSGAALGTATAVGRILNDDVTRQSSTTRLNDTGVSGCSNDLSNGLSCDDPAAGTDQFPGQDGEIGNDADDDFDADGVAGFIFTKLDDSGNPLADQAANYAMTPWACVRDEITGLWWEVKTDAGSSSDRDWTYSWYNASGINDGGTAGVPDGGDCSGVTACDTGIYLDAVNAAGLCGFDDWRVPTRRELLSLMHFGAASPPYIDTGYFVNTVTGPYWSASPGPLADAAFVAFSDIGAGWAERSSAYALRLVRGGE